MGRRCREESVNKVRGGRTGRMREGESALFWGDLRTSNVSKRERRSTEANRKSASFT